MSDLSQECAPKRTSVDHFEFMGSRPNSMECDIVDFRALSAMAKARKTCVLVRTAHRLIPRFLALAPHGLTERFDFSHVLDGPLR